MNDMNARRPFLQRLLCRWSLLIAFGCASLFAQAQVIPDFPFSNTADRGCLPCYDTVRVLWVERIFDLSLLLPEWNPVVDWDHVETVEGIVVPYNAEYTGTHVSQEDFSAYHYTHDFGFNVRPDSAYRRVLARRIYSGHEIEHPSDHPDTLIDDNLHVEWESGLAIGNDDNPCAEANRRGESCGFFSAGHQRGEVIWNWPSMGDWVHCEGTWIWDRGHPPARTELHPLRLCVTRRAMRAYVPEKEGSTDSVMAMQIDIFASGDGGALNNNRPGQPSFTHPTKMSDRDYAVTIPLDWVPGPPTPVSGVVLEGAPMRYREVRHNGDTYTGEFHTGFTDDSKTALAIQIPWQTVADTAVFARTIYCWWDLRKTDPPAPKAQCYEVHFQKIRFAQRKDVLSRPEKVMWLEAGGQYLCLNEFVKGDNILKDGEAITYDRIWEIDQKLRVYAWPGQEFRVHAGGWENDGLSRVYGDLLDPALPCTKATKKAFHKHLWPATPFGLHGCLDDLIGEVHDFHNVDALPAYLEVVSQSKGRDNEMEQCPGANTEQNDVFTLWYTIRKVD